MTIESQMRAITKRLAELETERAACYVEYRKLEQEKRSKAYKDRLEQKKNKEDKAYRVRGSIRIGSIVKVTGTKNGSRRLNLKCLSGAYRKVTSLGKDSFMGHHVTVGVDGTVTLGNYITSHLYTKVVEIL